MDKIKNIIKYSLIMLIAIILLKKTYKGFELKEIWEGIKNSKVNWLILAIISNLLSHIFRAARWRLLMIPLKLKPSVFHTFIADLSGLFANLFLPRLGEIFRCTALKRMEKIPIAPSLTSVVIERSMDVIIFCFITIFSFFILSKKMQVIVNLLSIKSIIPSKKVIIIFAILSIFVIITSFLLKTYIKKYYLKALDGIKYFLDNITYILNNDNKIMIIIYTFFIWLFYFLSIYLVFFSIDPTSNLKLDAGIIILIASSLGLAAPIQGGGAGAMHLLVIAALNIFNISKEDSILSATLIHGVQFVTAVIAGGACMILSFFLKKR